MSETKHTATSLNLSKSDVFNFSGTLVSYFDSNGTQIGRIQLDNQDGHTEEEVAEYAERIVHCVNHFDEVLAAMKGLMKSYYQKKRKPNHFDAAIKALKNAQQK